MNFRKFYIFIFIALSQMAFAQNKGVLKGVVVEKATGETLPNASVTIVGTYYQTLTDFSGEFEIKDIKPGTYTIKVQFIGFSPTQINGVKIKKGQNKPLRVALVEQNEMLNTVTVVGRKNQVDLEQASSAITFSSEEISSLVAKGVEDIVAQQAGVQKTTDGIQIRGARVYETEYLVDGISAQDPLAGTGGGVSVSSSSLQSINLMTGGASAEYGGGSSGVVNTTIKEGGQKLRWSAQYSSDNFTPASFNTDRAEVTLSTPIPFTKKKLTLFTSANADITDHYFGATASQLNSSLFPGNPTIWAPRQSNDYTHTTKLTWRSKAVGKISLTNSHSLKVNQNSRTLQIVGFDALLAPGNKELFN